MTKTLITTCCAGVLLLSVAFFADADPRCGPDQAPKGHTGVWVVQKDGKEVSESSWKNGKRHGLSRSWHPDGKLRSFGNYNEGLIDGTLTIWSTNGLLTVIFVREPDGREKRIDYINGRVDQEQVSMAGQPLSRRMWHPNGTMAFSYSCKVGKPHGEERQWYPNGKLRQKGQLRNGAKWGVHTGWDKDGNIIRTWHYEDGKLTHITIYDKDKVAAIEHWKNGKAVRTEKP